MRQIKCEHCGYEFSVPDDSPLTQISCPSCGAMTTVPPPEDATPPPPRFDFKDGSPPATETKRCPVCGNEVPADAVLCVNCGYDWRTGRQIPSRPRPSMALMAASTILAAVLSGTAVYLFVTREKTSPPAAGRSRPRSLPARRQPATRQQPLQTQPAATTTAATVENVSPATPAPSQLATNSVAGSQPSPATQDSEREQLEKYRAWVTAKLDEKYPTFTHNQTVAIRLKSGIVYRGRFLGRKNEVIVILQKDATSREIPIASLDRPTRVRCDPAFRRKYIEYKVRVYQQRKLAKK